MLGFIVWVLVVLCAAGILGLLLFTYYWLYKMSQPKPIITDYKLADGDYEGDRPRPCPRCGGWIAIYVGDMDKCLECGLIHK